MKEVWKDIVKSSDRYKDFIILDEPIPFNDLFNDRNFNCVQIHSIQVFGNNNDQDIIGFSGEFKWSNNKITPLDGDSYDEDMLVYGYSDRDSWFDILVNDF